MRPSGVRPAAAELMILAVQGPGTRGSRPDFKPMLARSARPLSPDRESNGAPMRMAIAEHGNPGACRGTFAIVPATTVACANDAAVVDGLLGALDSHEFVFVRLMGLTDALGCA